MLTGLRMRVQSVLYDVPAKRKPALRRSDAPDALFATDLPLIAEADAVDAFRAEMANLGWRTEVRNGWITLDAVVPEPPYTIPQATKGECGSCISLLLRHQENAPADDFIRAAVKAKDTGKQPFERLCSQFHAEFAARLRHHEPLPSELLPYLCCAYHSLYD